MLADVLFGTFLTVLLYDALSSWKQASRMKEACDATNLKLLKDIYEKHCRDQ